MYLQQFSETEGWTLNNYGLRSIGGPSRGSGPPQSPFSPLDQFNISRLNARGHSYHRLTMLMPNDKNNLKTYSLGTPACLLSDSDDPICKKRHDLKFAAADNEKWGCKDSTVNDIERRFVRALCHFGQRAGIAILRCKICGTALSSVVELQLHRREKCFMVIFDSEDAPI